MPRAIPEPDRVEVSLKSAGGWVIGSDCRRRQRVSKERSKGPGALGYSEWRSACGKSAAASALIRLPGEARVSNFGCPAPR